MAEDKKGFILYADQKELFEQLPNDKAGELIKHIFKYVNDENPISEDLILNLAFTPIKQQLKRDLKKYESKKEDQSKAGIEGNLKRWNLDLYNEYKAKKITLDDALNIANSRKASLPDKNTSGTIANIAVKDTVTVKDNVKDNVKDINIRKAEFKNSLLPFLDDYGKDLLNDFFAYWTEHGDKDRKMRFEKEKSFGLSRRLSTWKKRETQFNKNNTNGNTKSRRQRFIDSFEG